MKVFELAVIPGDGIGQEVVPAALNVLRAVEELHGALRFGTKTFPWGCDYYVQHGAMLPSDGIQTLSSFDAVFLGAIGNPQIVPDHISLWGLLIKIRREFEQVINIRPAKRVPGITSPLSNPGEFDMLIVRENSEGEYSEIGGRIHRGEDQMAMQTAVFTRKGTERVIEYAFEWAKKRRSHVTSATKSNGIFHTMPFWDEVFADVKARYPEVSTAAYHIDALSAFMVTRPHIFDVIVGSNLFCDILSDIGGAIMGSIGIAPAANINLNGKYPSMFEPVHGSAPDIMGRGMANPIGQIWTAKMMLDHFGEEEMGRVVLNAVEETTKAGFITPDVGGKSTTTEVTEEICRRIKLR